MTRLWNLKLDNLDACKMPERDFVPALEDYFTQAIEQLSPKSDGKEQDKWVFFFLVVYSLSAWLLSFSFFLFYTVSHSSYVFFPLLLAILLLLALIFFWLLFSYFCFYNHFHPPHCYFFSHIFSNFITYCLWSDCIFFPHVLNGFLTFSFTNIYFGIDKNITSFGWCKWNIYFFSFSIGKTFGRLVNDSNFGWRGLRLLACRSPHFFTHSASPIATLPEYLTTMIKKLAKELPVSMHAHSHTNSLMLLFSHSISVGQSVTLLLTPIFICSYMHLKYHIGTSDVELYIGNTLFSASK